MGGVRIDSFSGAAADLPKGQREASDVLRVLLNHPRVSTWDMSETPWLCGRITELQRAGLVSDDKSEPYPWHRFNVTEAGRRLLMKDHL